LRWIPLLPLAAAAAQGVTLIAIRRPIQRSITWMISCGAVTASFALVCVAFSELVQQPEESRYLVDNLYTWIGAGIGNEAFSAELAFLLDPLSAVMALVVTGVGTLIHFYSIGYMAEDDRDDKGFQRFFCYLNLFTFAMLVLVLADNVVLMFVGWEGVGLCSYLLIGFWYSDRHNAYCGSKAFLVNRIGDFAFLVALFVLFGALVDIGHPTVDFREIERYFGQIAETTIAVPGWLPFGPEWRLVNVVGLGFFLGACGKSAQVPLYVWLPDAMAGPTPVSALIHAATMVTAGVYLVCRFSFLYATAPEASAVIAWTGGVTAVLGASIAIAQTDIKKVLAYSTVSQLGYMFVAAGCGAYSAAIYHLFTHAFFKALLFLAAGSVILAMHHEQDMDKMGGLRRRIPRTRWTFLIGTLAIAGFPPLSGFFSKDEILAAAWTATSVPGHRWLYGISLATAGVTSFYMFRLYYRIFRGKSKVPLEVRQQMEDPSGTIIVPLYILGFFAVVSGFAGLPQVWGDLLGGGIENSNSLAHFIDPVLTTVEREAIEHSTEYRLAGAATATALAGALLAWLLYMRRRSWPAAIIRRAGPIHRLVVAKYRVDEFYDRVIVRPLVAFSDRVLFRRIDAGLIDDIAVNGLARSVRLVASHGLKYAQSGLAQSYLLLISLGVVGLLVYLMRSPGS
jgi:NADH-quinone oxidoreductase subunit L